MVINIKNIINEAITNSKKFECWNYSNQFKNACGNSNDIEEKAVLNLLSDITSYHVNLDKPKEPFEPFIIIKDKRSAAPIDLTNNDINTLKELYELVDDCELKARISDILWVKDKSFKHGQEAINHYLDSASRLEDYDNWSDCFRRINRSLQLALMLGKDNQKVKDVNSYIEFLIKKINGDDSFYLTMELMRLLQEQKIGNPKEYIPIVEIIIARSFTCNDYLKARNYMEINAKWYQIDKNISKSNEVIKNIALSYEKEAQELINLKSDNYMKIVDLYEEAIRSYRRIPQMQVEINRLLKSVVFFKEQMSSNLKSFSFKLDATDIVNSAEKLLRGKTLIEAIIRLAFIQQIPTMQSLEKRVNERIKMSPFRFLTRNNIVDKYGKRIVTMPNFNFNDEKERKFAMEAYMLKESASSHNLFGGILISNALRIIKEEHIIKEPQLDIICKDNAFIPENRKNIFMKGLYEGFSGNFMVAMHLLIPQLENSFREFAKLCGDIVSTFDDDGKEELKTLNSVFEMENFVNAFDEDLLFDLRSLLTEKCGSNMRNRMAHGLLEDDDVNSSIAIYVWWITLRLCCMYSRGINSYSIEISKKIKE